MPEQNRVSEVFDLIGALYNLAELNFERGNARDAEIYLLRYMRLAEPSLAGLVLGGVLAAPFALLLAVGLVRSRAPRLSVSCELDARPGGIIRKEDVAIAKNYLDGEEPPGRWWGKAASRLGLGGVIDSEALLALMAGEHPASGQLLSG